MSLITRPLLLPTSASERISSSMLASLGSSVSATVPSSSRVVRVAVDLPLHRPALVLLRCLLDGDVREVLRGLQLLREGREVFVGHREPAHDHVPVLFAVLGDPGLVGNDGGELVHHLDRPGAAFLERVEDLQLVLERLLVLGERLDLADRLLQLGDLVAGGGDARLERVQAVLLRLPPGVVAEQAAHQDEPEEDQLLAAEFALLGGADGQEVDVDHGRLSAYRSLDRRRASPMATAADGATSIT